MKKIIFLIFISNFSFSQNSEIYRLTRLGDRALNGKEYQSAKTIFQKIIQLDSLNNNAWYGLGTSELNLGEKDLACEHLYKSYKLKNSDAPELLQINCEHLPQYFVMLLPYVEEKPKFTYKEKEYPLFDDDKLSEKYKSFLAKEMKNSDFLKNKLKGNGKIYISFHFNIQGKFDGDILPLDFSIDLIKSVKPEIRRIFQIFNYKPAQYKGKPVEFSNNYLLPIDFGN